MDFLGRHDIFQERRLPTLQSMEKDHWVFSASLLLVYRLVRHSSFLDDMLRARQIFTCKKRHFDPSYYDVKYGYNEYNTWIHRCRQHDSSILWAFSLAISLHFCHPRQCGLDPLLALLTLTAGSLMLQSWRLLLMLCPTRK